MKTSHPILEDNFNLYVANIKASYYQALQYRTILDAGLNWYADANSEAAKIARRHKVELSLVCGVIAALSPNNFWKRNLIDTELLLEAVNQGDKISSFKVCTFEDNKNKAWMIALGLEPLEVLRGNKVRAFYKCIFNPNHAHSVCIDSHATNIALGCQASIANTPTLTNKRYKLLAEAYRTATQQINLESLSLQVLPLQTQAITWTLYRVLRKIDTTHII